MRQQEELFRSRRPGRSSWISQTLIPGLWMLVVSSTSVPGLAQLSLDGADLLIEGVGLPGLPSEDDRFGRGLVIADFDGNGDGDLAIGAPGETVSDFVGTGQVTVIYGSDGELDHSTAQHLAIEDLGLGSAILDEQLGYVLAAGDFDGDSFDDLTIGVPWRTHLPTAAWNTGMVIVIYGGLGGLDLGRVQVLQPGLDDLVGNMQPDDRCGRSLAVGDFNGDEVDDLAIGIPLKNVGGQVDAGELIVIYGVSSIGLVASGGTVDSQLWNQGTIGLDPDGTDEQFSSSLAVGDWNGDGIDDLAVGTPYDEVFGAPSAGSVTILRGSENGLTNLAALRITEAGSTPGTFGANDAFGAGLSSGDFDCDGVQDLAIGVPSDDFLVAPGVTVINAGAVVLHFGSPTGFHLDQGSIFSRDLAGQNLTEFDLFGSGLAAGDFDGDSCTDLVVGVPGGDPSGVEGAGVSLVFAGDASGTPIFSFSASQDGLAPGTPEPADHLGSHFAAGDFGGDRADDLAIGVPLDSSGGSEDAGQVNLFFGAAPSIFADGFESGDTSAWQ